MLANRMIMTSAAAIPATRVYLSSGVRGSGATSHSFTGLNFSTASATRQLVAGIFVQSGNQSSSAVTIGGISATKKVSVLTGYEGVEFWTASVPSGTSGTLAVTFPSAARIGYGLWAVYDASTTPNATVSDITSPFSQSISVTDGGVLIGLAADAGGGTSTYSWSGVTEDFEDTIISDVTDSGGSSEYATATTATLAVTITSLARGCMVGIAFQPL